MIPALTAHLWQSTLFAGMAWLLTLALRKNAAKVRYRIWFIASVKFLVPFSLLVGLGTLVPRRAAAPPIHAGWVDVAEQFGQPLLTIPAAVEQVAVTSTRTNRNYFAAAALTLWACGFVTIAICWLARWKRVGALRSLATPVIIPGIMELAVPVMSVPGLVEPGIFGIFRPVLLLPERIGEQLDRAQLDAILAHELCHVHRRDNLTAAIHMVVQATFWFHPLVWWLGARLVDERERACDEEVLRLGIRPQVYAAGILSVCKLYVETPLVCVSGVTGANLKRRIEAIMKNRIGLTLNFPRKAALAAAGVAAFVLPIVVGIVKAPSVRAQSDSPRAHVTQIGPTLAVGPEPKPLIMAQAQTPPIAPAIAHSPAAPPSSFDAASIKPSEITQAGGRGGGNSGRLQFTPGRVFGRRVTTRQIILEAYHNLTDYQISGGPNWLDLDVFDLEARTEVAADIDQVRTMLRALLAERFKLIVRGEKKEMPVYALTVAGSTLGPQIHPITREDPDPPTEKIREMLGKNHASAGRGTINLIRANMEEFAHRLSALSALRQSDVPAVAAHAGMDPLSLITGPPIDRPVIDKTGLQGDYFIVLAWNFDEDVKSLLPEELGLKLVPEKALVDTLTIDRIEKPDAN